MKACLLWPIEDGGGISSARFLGTRGTLLIHGRDIVLDNTESGKRLRKIGDALELAVCRGRLRGAREPSRCLN